MRARACMRARPSAPPPPVGGEVRAAPRAAVGGTGGGGAVAMARRARPHTNGRPWALPPQLPPTGRSLLPLLPPAHALHTDPGPWVPGHHRLISAAMGPARPKGDGLALRGSLPGRVPAPPSGLCNRKRGSALAIRRPPGGKAGQGERKGAPGPAVCLPMRPGQRPTWGHPSPASSASPNSRAWLWGRE